MYLEFKRLVDAFYACVEEMRPEAQKKMTTVLTEFSTVARKLKEGVEDSVTGDKAVQLILAASHSLNKLRDQANKLILEAGVHARLEETIVRAYMTLTRLELVNSAKNKIISIKDHEGPALLKKAKRSLLDLQLQWGPFDVPKVEELINKTINDIKGLSKCIKEGSQAKATQAFSTTLDSMKFLRNFIDKSAEVTKFNSMRYIDVAVSSLRELDLTYKGQLALFVTDRVFLGAKFIDRTVGVSNTVVSIDHKFSLAPKLEGATMATMQKVQALLGNEKVATVVNKARMWDDHYSSGKIQSAAEKGYDAVAGTISQLWSGYKVQRTPPVAA